MNVARDSVGRDQMADDFIPDPERIHTAAEFFGALRALRDRAGLTIREVARRSGTRVSTAGDYFASRHLPLDRQQFARILAACGETDPARIEQWQGALSRARRVPGRRGEPPYRGLAPFESRDARLFFGREDITARLAYLAEQPSDLPLLLVGPSGAGKSSLLRAGLVPRLHSRTEGDGATAGGPPGACGNQAGRAAAGQAGTGQAETGVPGPGAELIEVYDLMATGTAGLAARIADLAATAVPVPADRAAGDPRPAVIVDQFEAVFTLCADESERRSLIDALCDLARTRLVVLALRADFYGQAIRYSPLMRALQERQVVLGPMTVGQVRRAVVEPARMARVDVAEGLVEVVLDDLAPSLGMGGPGGADGWRAYEPGALPLLSHALLAAWEHSQGGTLTVADYLAGGGIRNALSQSAERAYESLTPGQQRLARWLFLRLVHLADDLPPSRASVSLEELRASSGRVPETAAEAAGDADRVLSVFIDERMITVDTGAAQLTHDALLTAWPRLRAWIEESAEELRTRRRISQGARAWTETGREEAALWRGSQLAVAREWAADPDRRAALLPPAREFIDASVAAGTARELRERQRTRRLRSIIAVLTVLVLAVAGLTGYAFQQRRAASAAEGAAIASRDQANSREVAFVADEVRAEDPAVAAQLSLGGYQFARTPEARASLLASAGAPIVARITDSAGVAQCVSLSPDRRLLVAANADGTVRLWNVAAPGRPVLVATLLRADRAHPVYTAAFSPDGRVIAAAGAARTVRLWAVSWGTGAGGGKPRVSPLGSPLAGPASTVYSVAFSPDGRTLAAGSADGTVRLWDVSDPGRPAPDGPPIRVAGTGGAPGYVQSVAFSPDGRTLAAGTSAGTVWLWDAARPAAPVPFRGMPLTGPADFVSGVAFSPDGRTLAASSHDHRVWLWDVRPGGQGQAGRAALSGTLAGAANWVHTVAFSPHGRFLAAGTSDASVLVWNLAEKSIRAVLPQPQPVTSVAWDGSKRIAAANADGDIALWALPSPVIQSGNSPDAVAYSPGGRTLAIGGSSLQLRDVATHDPLAVHPLPPRVLADSLAFGRGGTDGHGPVLAAALSDGTVALFDGRTLAPLATPFRVSDGTGAAESVAFSPDGTMLATGADDGTVRLFDVTDPARPRRLAATPGSDYPVYTVAFSPDGTTVAAASLDDAVRLWRAGRPGGARPGLTRIGPVLGKMSSYAIGLAFSPRGGVLAVGSADKTVHLWNVTNPARPVPYGPALTGPAGYVWAAAFSPDGKTLAAGVTDGTVWMWNVANPARPVLYGALTGLPDHVYSVAFSPSGRQLAATSFEGTVHLWDTSPAAARAALCADLGQPLTPAQWASYVPGVPYRSPCPAG